MFNILQRFGVALTVAILGFHRRHPASVLVAAVFVVSLGWGIYQAHTTVSLQVAMRVEKRGNGQVFFAGTDGSYSEQRSKKFLLKPRITAEYFLRFKASKPQKIRIDPTDAVGKVVISKIILNYAGLFSRHRSRIDLGKIRPLNGIANINASGKAVTFDSTGNDPSFAFQATDTAELRPSTYFYTHELIISALISLIVLLLWRIFAAGLFQLDNSPRESSNLQIGKSLVYALILFIFIQKLFYYAETIAPGVPPDEAAHMAYVNHLAQSDRVIPDFENMRIDVSGGGGRMNYLGHPPLYYHFMNLFSYETPQDTWHRISELRNVNILLSIFSIVLFLWIGVRSDWPLHQHFLYGTLVTSVPMLAFLGASINNDNLAVLGGAIALWGLLAILEGKREIRWRVIMAVGFAAGALAKLTVVLLLGGTMLVAVLLFALSQRREAGFTESLKRLLAPGFFWTLPIYAIPMAYFLFILYRYGVIHPSYWILHPEAIPKSAFYVPPEKRIVLSPLSYLSYFSKRFFLSWTGILAHKLALKTSYAEMTGMLAVMGLATAGFFLKYRGSDPWNRSAILVAKAGAIVAFIVVIVQMRSSYGSHLAYGQMGGAQSRYYLPLLPVLPILAIHTINQFKSNAIVLGAVLFISFHLLYSDFFYFLTHWGKP